MVPVYSETPEKDELRPPYKPALRSKKAGLKRLDRASNQNLLSTSNAAYETTNKQQHVLTILDHSATRLGYGMPRKGSKRTSNYCPGQRASAGRFGRRSSAADDYLHGVQSGGSQVDCRTAIAAWRRAIFSGAENQSAGQKTSPQR